MKCAVLILSAMMLFSATPLPTETPDVEIVEMRLAETPTPIQNITPTPAPQETERPELPVYDYPSEDARCLERAIWSVCPDCPSDETRLALCEVVQNMVDDGRYKDTIRYTLLMKSEFPSYDPDAFRSDKNKEVADYAMRSWYHEKATGDRSYRIVPQTGLRFSFYEKDDIDYITVRDWNWNIVYDSGE